MILLALLASACALAAVAVGTVELSRGRRALRTSLARAAAYGRQVPGAEHPRHRSVPLVGVLARLGTRLTPGRERADAAAHLHAAGLRRIGLEAYFAIKGGLTVAGLLLGAFAGAGSGGSGAAVALALVFGAVGFALPDLVLRSRARSRRERILQELPNALDLLAVSVEAGLGLDGALSRYAQTARGPLAEEVALTVSELRVGLTRADALRGLAERVPSPETSSFVRGVVYADQLGASLGGTLRTLAQEVRFRRQAVAEEQANGTPVKMLFPTVLCIFPALFVVVLGPALLGLVQAL